MLLLLAACLPPPQAAPSSEPAADTPEAEVRAVDLAPTRGLLVEGLHSGRVRLRDHLAQGSERELLPALPAPCWVASFSPDGERVAVLDHQAHVAVWTLAAGEAGRAWSDVVVEGVQDERPFSLAFPGDVWLSWSSDGAFLAAQVHEGKRAVWTREGRLLEASRASAAVEPCWLGAQLVLPHGRAIEVRQVAADGVQGVRVVELDEALEALAVSPDGSAFWTGHEGGRLCRRDPVTGEVQAEHRLPDPFADEEENDWVASIALSPTGDRVAYSLAPSVHVRVLDARTLELVLDSGFLAAHFGEPMPVTWSPDGSRVLGAFPCAKSPLYSFSEGEPGTREVLEDAVLPRFRGDTGVALSGWRPLLVDARGEPIR